MGKQIRDGSRKEKKIVVGLTRAMHTELEKAAKENELSMAGLARLFIARGLLDFGKR
jgi:hypothetical protein